MAQHSRQTLLTLVLPFAVCVCCLSVFCIFVNRPISWVEKDGHRWKFLLQVIRGPRPRSSEDERSNGATGSSRALETAQGCHGESQGPKPRLSPDAIREIAQSSVTRRQDDEVAKRTDRAQSLVQIPQLDKRWREQRLPLGQKPRERL